MKGFYVKSYKDCINEALREWIVWFISAIYIIDVILVVKNSSFSKFDVFIRCFVFGIIIFITIFSIIQINYNCMAIEFPDYILLEREAIFLFEIGDIALDEFLNMLVVADIERKSFWSNISDTKPNTYNDSRRLHKTLEQYPKYFSEEFNMYEYYHKNGKTPLFYMMMDIAANLREEEIENIIYGEA